MKVIGYGLGNIYKNFKKQIELEYDVIGWCDSEIEKIKDIRNGITPEELMFMDKELYDNIIILPIQPSACESILNKCTTQLRIPREKIIFIQETDVLLKKGNKMPEKQIYGQWGEDAILESICQKIGLNMSCVQYLEIGVWNPILLNNTYTFYERGGRGILVDANPAVQTLCNVIRPEDKFLNYAICGVKDAQDTIKLWLSGKEELSSLDINSINDHGASAEKYIEVPLIGINDLLKRINDNIDLVSIDIEGMDYEVISSWDFSIKRPKILVIELVDDNIVEFMSEHNYIWYATNCGNSFFVDGEIYN